MACKQSWPERLFGKHLIKCPTIKDNNVYELIDTAQCLINRVDVVAIYFSFANINAQDTTTHLLSLYRRLNGECAVENNDTRVFEVVQVVLWANNDVFGDFERSHKDCIVNMPWLAVPFHETDLKTRLSRRYKIKVGVPTLVLLDAAGAVITVSGKERLIDDPLGDTFPWRPRPVDQVLKDVELISGGLYASQHSTHLTRNTSYEDLPGDVIRAFYFSANWCPPCRAFTPQLIETYKYVRKKEPRFEVIFVSSDRSADSFTSYISSMPWLVIPYQYSHARTELAQLYGVRGIPTVLLIDGNGQVVTHDARTEIQDDPKGQNYPWKPRPVNILTERFATKLHDYPAIVLFIDGDDADISFAQQVLNPAADTYYKSNKVNFNAPQDDFFCVNNDDDLNIQFLIGVDSEASDAIRDLIGLDDLVPLLVGVDLPNKRFAVMDDGNDVTVETVREFVDKFQRDELEFKSIHE